MKVNYFKTITYENYVTSKTLGHSNYTYTNYKVILKFLKGKLTHTGIQ